MKHFEAYISKEEEILVDVTETPWDKGDPKSAGGRDRDQSCDSRMEPIAYASVGREELGSERLCHQCSQETTIVSPTSYANTR